MVTQNGNFMASMVKGSVGSRGHAFAVKGVGVFAASHAARAFINVCRDRMCHVKVVK